MITRPTSTRYGYLDLSRESPLLNTVLFLLVLIVGLGIALLPLTWAAVLVLGSMAFVLTLIRPEYGLYMLVFAVPFGSIREVRIGTFTVGVTEALVGLILAAWLARMIAAREVRFPHPPLLLPLLIFLGVALLSWSTTFSLSYSLKETLKWVEVLSIYLFVAGAIDQGRARRIIICILAAGSLQALVGFYQFFGQVGPEHFVLFDRFMRAYGTFEQPNPYAGYLGLVLPLAYGLSTSRFWFVVRASAHPESAEALTTNNSHNLTSPSLTSFIDRRASEQQAAGIQVIPGLLFYGLSFALMGAAMIMSWSRGAWLGFAAAFVVMNVVRSRRAALLFALIVTLVIFLLLLGSLQLLPDFLSQRFADVLPYFRVFDVRTVEVTSENWAVVERMAHWQSAWYMFSDHPWLGVGIGNYVPVYPIYAMPNWDEPLGHAHNYYLNIAAETGLVGLTAYLILWGACLRAGWRALRHASDYWGGMALGILGILTHLTVHNFFDDLYVHGMYIHFAILLGLLYVINRSPERAYRIIRSKAGPRAAGHTRGQVQERFSDTLRCVCDNGGCAPSLPRPIERRGSIV